MKLNKQTTALIAAAVAAFTVIALAATLFAPGAAPGTPPTAAQGPAGMTAPGAAPRTPPEDLASADLEGLCATVDMGACLSDLVLAEFERSTTTDADAFLERMIAETTWGRRACHEPSHALGRASYAKHQDLAAAIDAGGFTCEGGYVHGVFEAWGDQASPDELEQDGWAACKLPSMSGHADSSMCPHALGHAVWAVYGNTEDAIAFCADRPKIDMYGCSAGVLMLIVEQLDPASEEYPDTPEEVDALCLSFPDQIQGICYEDATWPLYLSHGTDATATIADCAELTHAEGPMFCARKVAISALGEHNYEPAPVAEFCLSGPAQTRPGCFFGAASAISRRSVIPGDVEAAEQLCALAPDDIVAECVDNIHAGGT